MLPEGALRANRVWKRFRADRRPRRLRDALEAPRDWMLRSQERARRYRWALRDIDFEIEPGESVGLIGMNGSGKSTLLKILNSIMYPYAGSIEIEGRVGALIDVRSGIHPQLTGRENIFMFGALLGLGRRAIATRFDDIVAFAELELAIDRQAKFYSSGMQMRLGFAVAAFLEPDVLLIDEVLAVGDTSFQQRCLDKMRSVRQDGTTLVFVSHDLNAVEAMCDRALWLADGCLAVDGTAAEVLGAYRSTVERSARADLPTVGPVRFGEADVGPPGGGVAQTYGPLDVHLRVESDVECLARVIVGLTQAVASPIFVVERDVALRAGRTDLRCHIARLPLPHGRYAVWAGLAAPDRRDVIPWRPVADVDVLGPNVSDPPSGVPRAAPVAVEAAWDVTVT